jgi:hypothetical protein
MLASPGHGIARHGVVLPAAAIDSSADSSGVSISATSRNGSTSIVIIGVGGTHERNSVQTATASSVRIWRDDARLRQDDYLAGDVSSAADS